ncbi:MAG: hypothetical protein U0869_25935 [Chloroflexota bacterium]
MTGGARRAGRGDLDPVELAAVDNARWCDAVCRAHGLRTSATADLWICHDVPPRYLPCATTLRRGPGADAALRAQLAGRGGAPGGVKDGFLELDLSDLGLRELFRAEWLWRAPPTSPAPTALAWRRATTPAGLAAWEAAWEGSERPADVPVQFPPALLADAGIALLAGFRDAAIAVVAALSLTEPVVGVSNVAGSDPASDDGWADLPSVAARWFPGRPLVGYERGEDLAKARRHGFTPTGPLRVWVPV